MSHGQVAVVDLLTGELQRAVAARGPSRPASFGQRGPAVFERHRVDRVAQVLHRLLVGEDDAAIATDRFVGAGLLGMPVRVDQRVDAVRGELPDADVPTSEDAYRCENGQKMAGPGCTVRPPSCEHMTSQAVPKLPGVTYRVLTVDDEMGIVLAAPGLRSRARAARPAT